MNRSRKAELMLIMLTLIWGATFPSIKVSLSYISPFLLMGFRFASAFVFFVLINRLPLRRIPQQLLARGVVLGVIMFLGYGLQTLGLQYTSAARSGFITYFYALLVPVFQFFIIKRKPLPANLLGLVIAFAGLTLITGGLGNGSFNKGDVITLAGAVSFSLYIVYLSLWTNEENSIVLTALQMLVTSILAFLACALFETPYLDSSPVLWGNILYLSLFGSVVAVYVMTRFQNYVTPTRAAILYSMEPVFSVLIAVLVIDETFSGLQVLGSLLIISGVLISEILEIRKVQES